MKTAEYFISKLDMEPHPEGGYYKSVYRSSHTVNSDRILNDFECERALYSTIYFLLKPGQVSVFHQLKFDEVWFYHYGSPVHLHMIDAEGRYYLRTLGLDIGGGENPQLLVPADIIFAARPKDSREFSLVSNMVSPGFDFRDFVLYSTDEMSARFPHLSTTIKSVLK